MTEDGVTLDIDFAAAVETAAESILITTGDLKAPGPAIIYVNPAFERMTGWSSREILGQSPRLLQGPKTDLRIFTDLEERIRRDGIWEGLTVNYRKDGSAFWMEWSIVPLKSDSGRAIQYLAVQRDVSARIEAEERLQEARISQQAAERARANLARYFSPKLVETLSAKDQPLGAVRRQNLAVLFADIIGFTTLSESLPPEEVMELLREIHGWMEKAIFQRDGSIEGYIGDAVLAIFGFPEAGPHDASNALACAYDLLTAAQAWNEARAERGLTAIKIGIGLYYGPAVLGDVGTEEYVEFTVIGDTVNTASRLQQATRSLGCDLVVGQALLNAIEKEGDGERDPGDRAALVAPLQPQGDLAIRGRREKVAIFTFTADGPAN